MIAFKNIKIIMNVNLPKKYEIPRVMIAHKGLKYTEPKANGVAIIWLMARTATRDLIPIFATNLSLITPPTTTPMLPITMVTANNHQPKS